MENNERYLEACAGGERAGLYYTCVNSFLTPEEVAYIVDNCEARVLITSAGSAVTSDVADGDLRMVRGEQIVKPGWADRFHDAMRKKKAAKKD